MKPFDQVPTTFLEAVTVLFNALELSDTEHLLVHGVDGLHFGLGASLRNNWLLWEPTSSLHAYFRDVFGLGHADDMSSMIIETISRLVNGKELDLVGQIKFYHDFWIEQGVNPQTQKSLEEDPWIDAEVYRAWYAQLNPLPAEVKDELREKWGQQKRPKVQDWIDARPAAEELPRIDHLPLLQRIQVRLDRWAAEEHNLTVEPGWIVRKLTGGRSNEIPNWAKLVTSFGCTWRDVVSQWYSELLRRWYLLTGRISKPNRDAQNKALRIDFINATEDIEQMLEWRWSSEVIDPRELKELLDDLMRQGHTDCNKYVPDGYASCTRTAGHDGPCAHYPLEKWLEK